MQYPETLPLEDHEVVLTFGDGPLPHNSNQILDILASECVKATFFEIGRMAQVYPEGVRKLRKAEHSIGTHTQNHPLSMDRMPIDRARQEIDDGIASVKAALGDDTALAPFYRNPGLFRAGDVEDYLASQGIQIVPIFWLTTGGMFRPHASTISRSSGLRRKEEASCCCTTSRRERSPHCQGSWMN